MFVLSSSRLQLFFFFFARCSSRVTPSDKCPVLFYSLCFSPRITHSSLRQLSVSCRWFEATLSLCQCAVFLNYESSATMCVSTTFKFTARLSCTFLVMSTYRLVLNTNTHLTRPGGTTIAPYFMMTSKLRHILKKKKKKKPDNKSQHVDPLSDTNVVGVTLGTGGDFFFFYYFCAVLVLGCVRFTIQCVLHVCVCAGNT